MEFIENVEKEEFEKFVETHPVKAHFMQSYYWGEVQKNKHFTPFYVGLKEEGSLVATALILEKKVFKNIKYLYCPRGFVTDYRNTKVVSCFVEELKKFTKKRRAMFFRMDPDIPLSITKDQKEKVQVGEETLQLLLSKKFHHNGFNQNFENNQPRFTFRLSLEKPWEEIYGSFHPTTRKILNKGNQYHLHIYKGTIEDLDAFYVTMQETAKREHIIPSKLEYYKTFYTVLQKQGMSDLYMVKVNLTELKLRYQEKIEALEAEENTRNEKKQQNKEKQEQKRMQRQKQIEKLKQELSYISTIPEQEFTLSSILTVKYKDMVWTIHGGNHSLLRELNANYLLYEQIIKDAKEENYKTIDFFGTTGNPTEDNPIYGIHLFKKRLGGDLYEFIGEFDYINQKLFYYLYHKLLPIIRKKQKEKNIQKI